MLTKGLLFGFILFNKYVTSEESDDCSDDLMMPQVNMLSCNNHIILPFTQMPLEAPLEVNESNALYISPIVEGVCAPQSAIPGSYLFECIDDTNATLTVFKDDDCSMDPSVEIISCENADGTIGSCSCSCPESSDNAYAKINFGINPTCQTSGPVGNVEFPIAVGVCFFDTTGVYTQYYCGKYNNDTNIYGQSHSFATLEQCKAAQPVQTRDVPETCGIYAANQIVPPLVVPTNITWQITACTQTLDCSDDILSLSSNIKYITSLIISIIIAFIVQ
mmetsp:Transcript_95782/g.117396  ORF Transcript_95782/g.117396 Transcript_95782/m.117396 type:complete len:276 (+) Transcript_95782:61-888(+)